VNTTSFNRFFNFKARPQPRNRLQHHRASAGGSLISKLELSRAITCNTTALQPVVL
jgi:hypothetical protein